MCYQLRRKIKVVQLQLFEINSALVFFFSKVATRENIVTQRTIIKTCVQSTKEIL